VFALGDGGHIRVVSDTWPTGHHLYRRCLWRHAGIVVEPASGARIATHFLLSNELGRLDDLLATGPRLVFVETPTNPTLEIFDIAAIAATAHRHCALLAVDNTFATPVNQRPLALGADIVMHSATKYLGGHSDLTAGALMGSHELLAPVAAWRKNLGQMPAPKRRRLLSRSLRTLVVRVERQNATAQKVAEAMTRHPSVAKVYYPGLPDFPGHMLAQRQMKGFGGMLTIETRGGGEAARRAADRLELFALAPSLGGVESLVTQHARRPTTISHWKSALAAIFQTQCCGFRLDWKMQRILLPISIRRCGVELEHC
jgi:cystathionine beta-lyase/cystathionine gamma-synthase